MYKPGQPEILRAVQRDEAFLGEFHETVTGLIQSILGVRKWIKLREYIRIGSELTYYSLTTLSNRQTLGEEYTGIFQAHSSGRTLQPKHVQLLMIILSTCGEKLILYSLKKLEIQLSNMPDFQLQNKNFILSWCIFLRKLTTLAQNVHKGIFYLNGEYYQIGKRLTGTKYMLIRQWLKDRSTLPAFRLLGMISLIHSTLNFVLKNSEVNELEISDETKTRSALSSRKNVCPLCLNNRNNASSIPCGHLFCWECILSWLQEQPECPLCRKSAQPSRVILLQNY